MATDDVIVVEIVVGHEAKVRAEPTNDGLTHNWTVFIKGNNQPKYAIIYQLINQYHSHFKLCE